MCEWLHPQNGGRSRGWEAGGPWLPEVEAHDCGHSHDFGTCCCSSLPVDISEFVASVSSAVFLPMNWLLFLQSYLLFTNIYRKSLDGYIDLFTSLCIHSNASSESKNVVSLPLRTDLGRFLGPQSQHEHLMHINNLHNSSVKF